MSEEKLLRTKVVFHIEQNKEKYRFLFEKKTQ